MKHVEDQYCMSYTIHRETIYILSYKFELHFVFQRLSQKADEVLYITHSS